jgi:4'-phosphopantetheinyl transferase
VVEDRVTVWYVDLRALEPGRAQLVLPEEDRAEIGRSRPEVAHERLASRVALRTVLGTQLGCPPERVDLVRRGSGKPVLAGRRPALHFSLSHATGRCAIAVSRHHPVGVDLEPASVDLARVDQLAARWLGPTAAASISRAGASERTQRFLQEWTRLEASRKATGRGLLAGPPSSRRRAPVVVDLRPGPCHVGALAVHPARRRARVTVVERELPWGEAVTA